MTKHTVRTFRGFNDFKHGSFTVYVTKKETIIRGVLKKTNNYSLYMIIQRTDLNE